MNSPKTVSKVDEARKAWSMAITKTDAHCRSCKVCGKHVMDAGTAKATGIRYTVTYEHAPACKAADALWQAEREAMTAYRYLGAKLPANEA